MNQSVATRLHGQILTAQGFVLGDIEFSAGHITAIKGQPIDTQAVRDKNLPLILPGFIDLHVHGGGGHDIMDGGEAARHVAELHAQHGTTALLATTVTAPTTDLEIAFTALAKQSPSGARILGVHLEGPFINPDKLGAQPAYTRPFSLDEIERLNHLMPIRLITLAPEIPGNLQAIDTLRRAGYRVQLGHSLASYEDTVCAFDQGAAGITHLFNAMSGLHHRAPGMAGAALAYAQYAEIIPDLLHVHPGAIRVALRAIPYLYCVTDSTAAAGMPDGDYHLGRQKVTKCLSGVRLADGSLAGSTLTMDQALRNLVTHLGLDLHDAAKRVSTYAADYLGLSDRGRLAPGAWADIAVLDRDLNLRQVIVEGDVVEPHA